MALRKLLSKHLSDNYKIAPSTGALHHSPIFSSTKFQPTLTSNAAKTNFHRDSLISPESSDKGFFRRFLHRNAMNQLPEFLSVPFGEKLREKLKGININGERLHLNALTPPTTQETATGDPNLFGISVVDARKLLRLSQVEKLKMKFKEIPKASISYSEFIQLCVEECGNEHQGIEFAKTLDQSGNVIILGNTVFLRPEQVLN